VCRSGFCGGDFDYWKDLRKDRPSYDAEKKRIVVEMQSRLDDLFPGFGTKVEVVDVATPCTTYRYTGNWKGSMMGLDAQDGAVDEAPLQNPARPGEILHSGAVGPA